MESSCFLVLTESEGGRDEIIPGRSKLGAFLLLDLNALDCSLRFSRSTLSLDVVDEVFIEAERLVNMTVNLRSWSRNLSSALPRLPL